MKIKINMVIKRGLEMMKIATAARMKGDLSHGHRVALGDFMLENFSMLHKLFGAYCALRFYVDAADHELKERGMTREDALLEARELESEIS